jgi:hypothetical protein
LWCSQSLKFLDYVSQKYIVISSTNYTNWKEFIILP